MAKSLNKEVLTAFTPENEHYTVEQLGNGLINHTFKITDEKNNKVLLLQQINKNVFKKPDDVQDNFIKLWQYKNGTKDILFPTPVPVKKSETLFIDSEGNYWRAFEFLDGTVTLDVPHNTGQASATAKTFGQLTAFLSSFNAESLHIVIPDFHNLSFRYRQFEEALAGAKPERLQKASSLIQEVKNRK
ncbi:MAG: aminoglycoside phosphotransferase [Chitinophagaceae bacterium]|nr:aminoglycoside phosphotransferase [Chitinophagaceae bacterium]